MSKNEYQGGLSFEVFSLQGKESISNWKISGSAKKVYEKEAKSFVYSLEGPPATTKLQYPKENSHSISLIQRYLVIQLYVPKGQDFSIELGVTDMENCKRRLHFSSVQKETQVTPLHAKIPLSVLLKNKWLNLCIDMVSVVGDTWRSPTHKALHQIIIAGHCKLRKIFTMKSQLPDTSGDDDLYGCTPNEAGDIEHVPRQLQLPTDLPHANQLLALTKIRHVERLRGGEAHRPVSNLDLDLNASGRRPSLNDSSYHIAFGTKVQGIPVSSSRNTQGGLTNRSNRSALESRLDDPGGTYRDLTASITTNDGMSTARESTTGGKHSQLGAHMETRKKTALQRQISDTPTEDKGEHVSKLEKSEFSHVQPHPPREPSKDRMRRKIRVKTRNPPDTDRVSSADSVNGAIAIASGGERRRIVSDGDLQIEQANVASNDQRISSADKLQNRQSLNAGKSGSSRISSSPKTEIKKDLQHSHNFNKKEYHKEAYQTNPKHQNDASPDDSVAQVIDLLNQHRNTSQGEDSYSSGMAEQYEESEEESDNEGMYLFVSKPKSAPRSHYSPINFDGTSDQEHTPKKRNSLKTKGSSSSVRGARPEEDFHSDDWSEDEVDMQKRLNPTGSRPSSGSNSRPTSGTKPHSNTRPLSGSNRTGANSRPGSGSRPLSGNNRPNSGNVPNNLPSGATHTRPAREHGVGASHLSVANIVPPAVESAPEPTLSPTIARTSPTKAQTNSVSRLNRKSLKEIPKDDVRLLKSTELAYDFTKYQVEDFTESFEANMLQQMGKEAEEDLQSISETSKPPASAKNARSPAFHAAPAEVRHMYDFSPTLTHSDDDTSLSTFQAPPMGPHNYMDEMKPTLSTDTLQSFNPRDIGMFSPPLPKFQNQVKNSADDFSMSSGNSSPRKDFYDLVSPRKPGFQTLSEQEHEQDTTDDESSDLLDLLYDPHLNYYYDPHSGRYYELV